MIKSICLLSVFLLSLSSPDYSYKFTSKKALVFYDYKLEDDKAFMIGELIDRKTREYITNINITVDGYRIGTVTDINGLFKIQLPQASGNLIFFYTSENQFKVPFSFQKDQLSEEEFTK